MSHTLDRQAYVPDFIPQGKRQRHAPRLTKRQRKALRRNAMVRDILEARRKIPVHELQGAAYIGRNPDYAPTSPYPGGHVTYKKVQSGIPWIRVG